MAYVSTIISGAASLGVLLGLISGIFFLVLTALKWVSRVRASVYEEELRRQKRFLINKSYLAEAGTSNFLETKPNENGFLNTLKRNKLQETLEENLQGKGDGKERWSERQAEAPEKDPSADTIKVREIIEKMVEKMIGGPLDGTTVGQLSSHSAWNMASELSPTASGQSNLKRLIKRIISEAMSLPDINDVLHHPKTAKESGSEDFKNKSYEDILATAILNKIIGNSQSKNYKENKAIDGATDGIPRPRLRSKKVRRSDDNDSKSDDDWSDTSRSDQLSLTIEEYIEEVTTTLEVSDDDKSDLSDFEGTDSRRIPFPESGRTVIDGTDDENSDLEDQNTATELITSTSSWEENWLFQKKRLRSTPNAHHPVPVPMLVPNPSEDYRALVGGVDADDLSDTSDCTDAILEDFITTEKPSTEVENMAAPLITFEEGDVKQIEAAEESFCDKDQEEIVDVRIPKTMECDDAFKETEEFAPQGVCEDVEDIVDGPASTDVLSQKDRESSIQDFSHQYEEPISSHSPSEGEIQISTNTDSEDQTTRCPFAEREKEKWNHPVPLAENPYSPENIEKREQRKKNEYFRTGTYTGESIDFPGDLSSDELFPSKKETEKLRFSRDYYVNASKNPSGMSSAGVRHYKDHVQVSMKPSYEATSSLGRRPLERNSKPSLFHDIADGSAKYFTPHQHFKNLFPPLQSQTIRRQHFSEVFKTANVLNDDPPKSKRKYRYGSNTVKLRPKVKEAVFKKPSLEQELSDFEQKSLREDIKHSLLRAKGASPNFILNPVFKADAVAKGSKTEPKGAPFTAGRGQEDTTNDESGSESGFGKSEPIRSLFRHSSEENTSRAYKNKSAAKDKTVNSLESHKLLIGKMTDEKSQENPTFRLINKKGFCLPSVKQLAKQFTVEEDRESKHANTSAQSKVDSKNKSQAPSGKEFPEKEFEVDYSPVPVSKIIHNLQHAAETPTRINHTKEELFSHTQPSTQMEVWRKVDDLLIVEKGQENNKRPTKGEAFKFIGKEVHSLTARSISKEFRDGLKNNTYKICPKFDKTSSGGESDQEGYNTKTPPTPSIDLKNMKKFWEEIIEANTFDAKQK